jgi:hypothetical protein
MMRVRAGAVSVTGAKGHPASIFVAAVYANGRQKTTESLMRDFGVTGRPVAQTDFPVWNNFPSGLRFNSDTGCFSSAINDFLERPCPCC